MQLRNMHKDNLTFRVISTNPVKNTITLRPTLGTLLKLNIAAGALIYVTVLLAKTIIEDPYAKFEPVPDNESTPQD